MPFISASVSAFVAASVSVSASASVSVLGLYLYLYLCPCLCLCPHLRLRQRLSVSLPLCVSMCAEQDLYDKFMCYCKTGASDLSASIDAAKNKIESLTAAIETDTKKKEQTEANLKEAQTSRSEAEDAMAQATALREKEAAAFAKVKADGETNVAALDKAIKAIETGVAGAFLQTNTAATVRRIAVEVADLPDATRQEVMSFLSGQQSSGYAPQSGEITGILKTMHDEMSKDLSDAIADESAAITNYEELMSAKKKEVAGWGHVR